MKKTIAIIVAATFVFAIASVSFAGEEKAEMAKPSENRPAEVTKTPAPTIEKMEKPGEQEKQEELEELTPEEQKQLKEFEEQEKQEELEELTPEEQKQPKDWK